MLEFVNGNSIKKRSNSCQYVPIIRPLDQIITYFENVTKVIFRWWVPKLDEFLINSNDAKLNKFVSTHEIGSVSDSLIGLV